MSQGNNHLQHIEIINGTMEHFEVTRILCDEQYGRGYCTKAVFEKWVSNPGLMKVALYDGEYAGFAVMLPATVGQIMEHMKMSEEEVLSITEGEPSLIYKSAAVQVHFQKRGIMKAMATVGLAEAKEMGYRSIFGSAWVYNNTIPIDGTFKTFGFTRLFERKLLWYDDEDYHSVR